MKTKANIFSIMILIIGIAGGKYPLSAMEENPEPIYHSKLIVRNASPDLNITNTKDKIIIRKKVKSLETATFQLDINLNPGEILTGLINIVTDVGAPGFNGISSFDENHFKRKGKGGLRLSSGEPDNKSINLNHQNFFWAIGSEVKKYLTFEYFTPYFESGEGVVYFIIHLTVFSNNKFQVKYFQSDSYKKVNLFLDGSKSMKQTDPLHLKNHFFTNINELISVPAFENWVYINGNEERLVQRRLGNISTWESDGYGSTNFNTILDVLNSGHNEHELLLVLFDGATNGYFLGDYAMNWFTDLVKRPFIFIMPEIGIMRQGKTYIDLMEEVGLKVYNTGAYIYATNLIPAYSEKMDEEFFRIFPNPANEWIILEADRKSISDRNTFDTECQPLNIVIYSQNGSRVRDLGFPSFLNMIKIDLSNLPSGAYMLSAEYCKYYETFPFIIQK